MAKAQSIDGLTADQSYGDAAALIVATRGKELIEHSEGVLDTSDIERVHDMRVATRRLRAALEVFRPCFPKREHADLLREVKDLADALGERRDRDVAIRELSAFSAQMPAPDQRGVETLIARVTAEQAAANSDLAPMVEPERVAALARRIGDLVDRAGDGTPG